MFLGLEKIISMWYDIEMNFRLFGVVALIVGIYFSYPERVQAVTTVTSDQGALQGYIGESVSLSPSFQVSSTVGVLTQTIIFDEPTAPPSGGGTPPIVPSPPTSSGGSGSGEKYDASNWILQRKYDQLVAERDKENEKLYTSAPKEEAPKNEPLLPNTDVEPIVEEPQKESVSPDTLVPEEKTTEETVLETKQNLPVKTTQSPEKNTQTNQSNLKDALQDAFYASAGLESSSKLTFEQDEKEEACFSVRTSYTPGFWHHVFHWIPWILLLAVSIYAWKIRKKYKKLFEEFELSLKKKKK